VCNCFLKDLLTYLDHINGKKHQCYLGYSMRVKKSTMEEVNGVLSQLVEKNWKREGSSFGIHGGGAKALPRRKLWTLRRLCTGWMTRPCDKRQRGQGDRKNANAKKGKRGMDHSYWMWWKARMPKG
jgi:hypothetical protein